MYSRHSSLRKKNNGFLRFDQIYKAKIFLVKSMIIFYCGPLYMGKMLLITEFLRIHKMSRNTGNPFMTQMSKFITSLFGV